MNEDADIFANFISQSFKYMIVSSIFPAAWKLSNVAPVFKKASKNSKENYRPVSILLNVSKIYEHLLFNQGNGYFEHLFSKCQGGF